MKTAVLLINLGSPENASRRKVACFLFQMLNDKRVIDLPFILRIILVNLIIIPFRINKSSKKYKEYFEKGEPTLPARSLNVVDKLNNILPENYRAFTAMRYGKPSLAKVIKKIDKEKYDRIIIFPQYPQYVEATTHSSIEKATKFIRKIKNKPEILVIKQFHDHPAYIDCMVEKIETFDPEKYDHVLFSYHSLPIRQVDKIHPAGKCNCSEATPENAKFCYKAACLETSRSIAEKLNVTIENYTTSYQSQIGKDWLSPFTDELLIKHATKGDKRVLIVSPSFVTDCLETVMDLRIEGNKLFKEHGGEKLQPVTCLNDDDKWIKALAAIIKDKADKSSIIR